MGTPVVIDLPDDPHLLARELAVNYVELVNGLVARGWRTGDVAFVAKINADAAFASAALRKLAPGPGPAPAYEPPPLLPE
jgi:hypothetical protein